MTLARLAGFATRALALLIDCAILNAAAFALGAALAWAASVVGVEVSADTAVVVSLAGAGWLLLIAVYLTTFWWLAGQTPGMRFMGIRVTDVHGRSPSLLRALRRLFGMFLAALPLGAGFLLVLVDDRRRGLHDRIARTLVVHSARSRLSDGPPPSLDRRVEQTELPGAGHSLRA